MPSERMRRRFRREKEISVHIPSTITHMLWVQVEGSSLPRSGIFQNGDDPTAAGPCTRAGRWGLSVELRRMRGRKGRTSTACVWIPAPGLTAFGLYSINLLANISINENRVPTASSAAPPLFSSHSYCGPEAIAFGSRKNTSPSSCPHSSQSPPGTGQPEQ